MWKYLNVSKPEPKKKKTSDQLRETQTEYDKNKRERNFKDSWQKEFPWLLYDQTHGLMFCKPCRSTFSSLSQSKVKQSIVIPDKYSKYIGGPFVSAGCKNFKHDVLKGHEKSEGHKIAQGELDRKMGFAGTSPAEKCIELINKATFDKLDKLFRCAHAIAKNSRPFTDFKWINDLSEKQGVVLGQTYRTDKSCRAFVNSMATVERKKIEQLYKDANFASVLTDGSTDVSVKENEIVYIRFCVNGMIHTFFLALITVDKADAKHIFGAMKQSFALCFDNIGQNETMKKIVGFGADGASVNTGMKSGVISILRKELSDDIVMVKCLVHRLELAYKEAMAKSKLYSNFIKLLSGLYAFYHKSPLQRNNFKTATEACHLDSFVVPIRIGGTRWISHTLLAIEKVWQVYPALVLHMDQVSVSTENRNLAPKAKCYHKLLVSRDLVVFGHFLQDVLSCLTKVSLELQRREASIHECHECVSSTLLLIAKMKSRDGYFLKKVKEETKYCGVELQGTLSSFEREAPMVLDAVISCLEKRYEDISEGLLAATSIVNIKTWPPYFVADFGDDHLDELCKHFHTRLHAACAVSEVRSEWTQMQRSLYSSHKEKVHSLTWKEINNIHRSDYPNCLTLVDLVLSLPASSAECERGFSQMKLVKNEYRNRLTQNSMCDLLTLQLHSPEITEYDPHEAIHHWNSCGMRSRRLSYNSTFVEQILEGEQQATNSTVASDTAVADSSGAAASALTLNRQSDGDIYSDYDSMSEEEDMQFSDMDIE